jgi:hypothetical protein
MKEMYTKPVSVVEAFATADVVTTSRVGGDGPIELPDEEV